MPASWITERPSIRRRPPAVERPRLELPLHQPVFERARPQREPDAEQTQRGAVVVDFYI